MVNTMLMISEIESGLRPAGMDPVDLVALIAEACDLFEPVADEQKVTVTFHRPTASVTVQGNAAALQRMVANLLDNAIKYTPAGGKVWIHLHIGKQEVEIQFQDTGIGIAPDDAPHIFERFYRCDRSRRHPGSGLGLSLARAVARAHDGTLEVHSKPGEGSLFTVHLPRA
jgi:signal transduction histidine kinase